jgi:hypothetical protein
MSKVEIIKTEFLFVGQRGYLVTHYLNLVFPNFEDIQHVAEINFLDLVSYFQVS